MSYDPHNDELSELLSAYIDGELSGAEQARVEQRLAESADYRQLHDEMRAIRASLESLPRYRVTEDLASAVLRRAERAMLSTPAISAYSNSEYSDSEATLTPAAPMSRTELLGRGLKAFRWTVVALAVAVLIMIVNPRRREFVDEVAQKSKKPDPQAEMAAAPQAAQTENASGSLADEKDNANGVVETESAEEFQAPALATEQYKLDRAAKFADSEPAMPAETAPTEPATPEPGPAPSAAADSTTAAPAPAEPAPAAELVADEKPAPARAAMQKLAAPTPPAAAAAPPGDLVEGEAKDAEANRALTKESAAKLAEESAKSPRDAMPADAPVVNQPTLGAKRVLKGSAAPKEFQWRLSPAQRLQGQPAADQVLVVHCRITSEALQSGAFEQLLARQEIVLETAQRQAAGEAGKPQTATTPAARPAEVRSDANDKLDGAESRVAETETAERQIDAVLVEASSVQIDATLNELREQHESLAFLAIQPTSADALGLVHPPATLEAAEKPLARKKLANDASDGDAKSFESKLADDANLADTKTGTAPAGGRFGGGGGGVGGVTGEKRRATAERIAVTDQLRRLVQNTSDGRDKAKNAPIAAETPAPAKSELGDAAREATSADAPLAGRRARGSGSAKLSQSQGQIEFTSPGAPVVSGSLRLEAGEAVTLQGNGQQLKQADAAAQPPRRRVLFLLHVVPSAAASQ